MNAAIRGNRLVQTVHIGALEFRVFAVLQNLGNNGVMGLQLFQHIGIGGIAPLGLFQRRQVEPFEKDFTQLLGGVDIELTAGVVEDFLLALPNTQIQHLTKGSQRLAVHIHTAALHLRQHRAKRQLQFREQRKHILLLQLFFQCIMQGGYSGNMGLEGCHRHRNITQRRKRIRIIIVHLGLDLTIKIGYKQLVQLIAAVGGCEQICGNGGVKHKAFRGQSLAQKPVHQGFYIVGYLFHPITEKHLQESVISDAQIGLVNKYCTTQRFAFLPLDCHAVQTVQRQANDIVQILPDIQQFFQTTCVGKILHLNHIFRLLLHFFGRFQMIAFNEFGKFQAQEEVIERILIKLSTQSVLRLEVNWGIAADGGKIVGKFCHIPSGIQFGAQSALDGWILEIGIQVFDAAKLLNEAHGRFFTHALHARDIVGGVPHQSLKVDHMDGFEAILLTKSVRSHVLPAGLTHAGGDKFDGGVIGDQLEGVFVTGDDITIPAIRLAPA